MTETGTNGPTVTQTELAELQWSARLAESALVIRTLRHQRGGGFGDQNKYPYTWTVYVYVDGEARQIISARGAPRAWTNLDRLERWPAYRKWFSQPDSRKRISLSVSRLRLTQHMPELVPLFDQLLELAGGSDIAGQFLSCYQPPRYLGGCSQAVWQGGAGLSGHTESMLVRNYDLTPALNEGILMSTGWTGRRVIASSEFLWGVADGMNEDGLAVSLAYGGRAVVGSGFGLPLILRYVLETCDEVAAAVKVLQRVPSHMAYNVTLLDAEGRFATVEVAPDKPARVLKDALATNHQGSTPELKEHARFTRTMERNRRLRRRLKDTSLDAHQFVDVFLRKPLYSTEYRQGFGTLYTAVYRPARGEAEWYWPESRWCQSFKHFSEGRHTVQYAAAGALTKPVSSFAIEPRGTRPNQQDYKS